MPYTRPTLQELIDRTAAEFSSRLGLGPLLRRSTLYVLARVWAGLVHNNHGHLDWVADQILPDTADAELLERHATIWGIARLAATPAVGTVRFTGTDGSAVPVGTALIRSDAVQYTTDTGGTISGGVLDLEVTASSSGELTNAQSGIELSLQTPIAGVATVVTVQGSGGLSQGADQEDDDALRARLLERIQNPPQGGAEADYLQWAKEVAGVTRVFVLPLWNGPGTVQVFFTRDDDTDGPIPDAAEVAAVQTYLDTKRPVTAVVTVTAPTELPLNPAITLTPNTAAVQANVTAALQDLLLRDASVGGTLKISRIREAISNASGEDDHVLTSPAADVVAGGGELHVLGTPVYT